MYFATTCSSTGAIESRLPLSAATALALLRHAAGTGVQVEIRDADGNLVTADDLQRQVDFQKPSG